MAVREPLKLTYEVPGDDKKLDAVNIIQQVIDELPEADRWPVFKAAAILLSLDR